jgi:hypothetical protein
MRITCNHYWSALVIGILATSSSAAIQVNGDISDWGITVGDNNTSNFNSFDPTLDILASATEDQSDTAGDGGYLGPQHGGQNYDAELLVVAQQDEELFVLLVTGQRPDNGVARFAPGDFLIQTSGGLYGLEVGGGIGGSGITSPLGTGAPGSTYTLDNHGYTTGHDYTTGAQSAGSIWKEVSWINDPVNSTLPVQFQINSSSVQVGTADYLYTLNQYSSQHAVMELSVNPTMFGGEMVESITWRPSCGNDELTASSINVVPEPAAALLLAAGSLILLPRRRTN